MSKDEGIRRNPYLVTVDTAAIEAHPDEQITHFLVGSSSERWVTEKTCVTYNGKAPGSRSPANGEFHAHTQDQFFFLLAGKLQVEIEGEEPFEAVPGDAVIYPAGVMHRNWNLGPEKVFHIQIAAPPSQP